MTQEIQDNEALASKRRKLLTSFKSNTRVYDDYSIEVTPKAEGEPSQLEVKKLGKSKRYVTNGKSPLACIELKVPADVPDRAAAFFKELDKLTRDIQLSPPQLPEGEWLLDRDDVKVHLAKDTQEVTAWMFFKAVNGIGLRTQLYNLANKIDLCLASNPTIEGLQKP